MRKIFEAVREKERKREREKERERERYDDKGERNRKVNGKFPKSLS